MEKITFGELNASHTGRTVRIDDGRQVVVGIIETIGHHLVTKGGRDVGVTTVNIKGKTVGMQRRHDWPVMILTTVEEDLTAVGVPDADLPAAAAGVAKLIGQLSD